MTTHGRVNLLVAIALAATLLCCSSEPPRDEASAERYVSRFDPSGRKWFPESELDPVPQKSPWMVIYEVTRYPHVDGPTPEQQAAADDLVRRSREAAERHGWFDFMKGLADGYRTAVGDQIHYSNDAFLTDGLVLDPDRPEYLMYYNSDQGTRLTGLMSLVSRPDEAGPQIGGPLTIWHYHVWTKTHCMRHGLIAEGVANERGECAAGRPMNRSPEMIHVWFVDHPKGPFASAMDLARELVETMDAG